MISESVRRYKAELGNNFHFTGAVERVDSIPGADPCYFLLVTGEGVRVTSFVAKDAWWDISDPSPGDFVHVNGYFGTAEWHDQHGRWRKYRGLVIRSIHQYTPREVEELRLEEVYSLDFYNPPSAPGEMQQG